MKYRTLLTAFIILMSVSFMPGCTSQEKKTVEFSITMPTGTSGVGLPGGSANFTLILSVSPAHKVTFKIMGFTTEWQAFGSNMSKTAVIDRYQSDIQILIPDDAELSDSIPGITSSHENKSGFDWESVILSYKYSFDKGPSGSGSIALRVYVAASHAEQNAYYYQAAPKTIKTGSFTVKVQ